MDQLEHHELTFDILSLLTSGEESKIRQGLTQLGFDSAHAEFQNLVDLIKLGWKDPVSGLAVKNLLEAAEKVAPNRLVP